MMRAELTTGQRVARARRRLGWDQAQLAAAVDRSVSWVSKIETGRPSARSHERRWPTCRSARRRGHRADRAAVPSRDR
ncbi:multiprotein-bridging factor 1 family protein [Streptomyces sp. NPDC008196]|uniref:helix-turn-helix domain-containing protein n=1 Tax=Streptomyces sp. NPDC008196 TaxID=3364819 RepID=UPI0036E89B90